MALELDLQTAAKFDINNFRIGQGNAFFMLQFTDSSKTTPEPFTGAYCWEVRDNNKNKLFECKAGDGLTIAGNRLDIIATSGKSTIRPGVHFHKLFDITDPANPVLLYYGDLTAIL